MKGLDLNQKGKDKGRTGKPLGNIRTREKGKEEKVEKPKENRKSASSKSTKSHYGRALGASPNYPTNEGLEPGPKPV
jgi:hypothetical protein